MTSPGTLFEHGSSPLTRPRLIRGDDNLVLAAFELMKLIPAAAIIDAAVSDGRIGPNTHVLETTSGTFGLALAIHCSRYGIDLTLVSDPVITDPLRNRLESLGATVDIVSEPAATGGIQQARLDRLAELARQIPDHFIPEQYANPEHPAAYAPVARFLDETIGPIGAIVGPTGSGGSMCGLTRELRRLEGEQVRSIAVDTPGSTLFGQPDGRRVLRGLGSSIHPPNLDHTVFDEVHWLSPDLACHATRRLHRRHGLFMGPTSGAAFAVASSVANRSDGRTVLAVLPDDGNRYCETVYSDRWLAEQGLVRSFDSVAPVVVTDPGVPMGHWTRLDWDRRTLADVIGQAVAS